MCNFDRIDCNNDDCNNFFCCLSASDRRQLEQSQRIDRELALLKRRFRATQKIVLLGAGESGKVSITIFCAFSTTYKAYIFNFTFNRFFLFNFFEILMIFN
jgi:hypothetical protein